MKETKMSEVTRPKMDPVTFEVLNHRLLSITEEMGIQYMRCSGSNVLITGNDAATAIMKPDGALVTVGPYIVTQGNVLPLIVLSTKEHCVDLGINDGDIVIVKKTNTANNGQIIVALIDDHEAMLKRIRKKGKVVALESANKRYETKIFGPDRVKVQGVLVSLYRNFQ